MPDIEQGDGTRVGGGSRDDLGILAAAAEMQGLQVAQGGNGLAKCRRFLAAELRVQPRYRILGVSDRRHVRVDEDAEDRRERRQPRHDFGSRVDGDAPLAFGEDESDRIGAGVERARGVVIRDAAADFDARQRSDEAGTLALIAPIRSAGFSAFMSVSPIRNPRAPASTSARVSSAE